MPLNIRAECKLRASLAKSEGHTEQRAVKVCQFTPSNGAALVSVCKPTAAEAQRG
jgi:hypothetical protein